MKQVITDSLVSGGVGGAGYLGVSSIPPHPDPVTHVLQVVIAIASILGTLWSPIKSIAGLFKKQPQA